MPVKILVGVPMFQESDLHPECAASLGRLTSGEDIEFNILHGCGSSSVFLRNILAARGERKIKQILDYDCFLSIDSDMSFTRENVEQLVAKASCDAWIISAAYTNKGPNSHNLQAGNFGAELVPVCIPAYSRGFKEVDWVGAGFMLIKKEMFESLDYPWFRCHVRNVNECGMLLTEDMSICMDAKKAGHGVYVDCDNHVGHCSR